jgi:hypothetical protein
VGDNLGKGRSPAGAVGKNLGRTGSSALKRRENKRFWPRGGHRRPNLWDPSSSPRVAATQRPCRIDNRRHYNMALPSSSSSGIRGIAYSCPDSSPPIQLAEDAKVTTAGTTPERERGVAIAGTVSQHRTRPMLTCTFGLGYSARRDGVNRRQFIRTTNALENLAASFPLL